jgi:hypothetical protein
VNREDKATDDKCQLSSVSLAASGFLDLEVRKLFFIFGLLWMMTGATGVAPYPAKHTATFSWLRSDCLCISTTRLGNDAAVFPGMGAKDHVILYDGRMI